MPVTPVPDQYLSQVIARIQQKLEELSRAIGKPADSVRDNNDNVLGMVQGSQYATLAARGQDASLIMGNGTITVADETGRDLRPIGASNFIGPVTGDTTGIHHGDVGTPTEAHNHYGDQHGNCYGFHYGPVGDGSTQNQINALDIYGTNLHGTLLGEVGVPGQGWHAYITCHGNVGVTGDNWQLHGTVIAPSERVLKIGERSYDDAGKLVDQVASNRWRWREDIDMRDEHEHIGPMIDDLAIHAPWLVRSGDDTDVRGYGDRDLIGVLWAALREERARSRDLESRIAALEAQQ